MLNSDKRMFRVKKADLLARLVENRHKHVAAYDQMVKEYRKRAEKELLAKLEAVRAGQKFSLNRWPGIIKPQSHEADYTTVIGLLDMATDDTIEITAQDYAQFVQDKWAWKVVWNQTVSAYSGEPMADQDDDE